MPHHHKLHILAGPNVTPPTNAIKSKTSQTFRTTNITICRNTFCLRFQLLVVLFYPIQPESKSQLSPILSFVKQWVSLEYISVVSWPPDPKDILERSHGRVSREKFCSVHVVKGVRSLRSQICYSTGWNKVCSNHSCWFILEHVYIHKIYCSPIIPASFLPQQWHP